MDNVPALTEERHPVSFLPRFTTELPFFYLTKQRDLLNEPIEFRDVDSEGRPIRWQVIPNNSSLIGAPGIEAHEVWVLLIKPAIDARRNASIPDPTIIPLGSVNHCLHILGWGIGGWEQQRLFRSIRQISAASCEADFYLPIRFKEGKPLYQPFKAAFSRLSLYAIGAKHVIDEQSDLFDFDLESVVYIKLHEMELALQRQQVEQPTDNDYLFSVKPTARRFYELVQPKLFGVINNRGRGPGYCSIRYSWYVARHHTLKPYSSMRRIKWQMERILKDHQDLKYISKVEYIPVKEGKNLVDVEIRVWPGPEAEASAKRIQAWFKANQPVKQLDLPFPTGKQPNAEQEQPNSEETRRLIDEVAELADQLRQHPEAWARFLAALEASLDDFNRTYFQERGQDPASPMFAAAALPLLKAFLLQR